MHPPSHLAQPLFLTLDPRVPQTEASQLPPAPASSIPGRHPGGTGHLTADGPQDRARVWMCRSGPSQEDSLTSRVIQSTQDSAIITAGPVLLWTWGCGGQRRARL
ncbi:uncharacterized protein LOC112411566 isoform X6 [Neophocaena asiaeorientalis asiaeorientalis]|uniref:Uncharacterized protein LOC112411566 isoform X6 n=1 Tax=Neophocaena asiaeorientalis asiaeorientalis TaxID=1706337 RepID=A0A341CW10_NEOAA|nr:uncharacterized protein LOC112411566 isoform X6 [Neophocaena asiaeorientalis asiaeorientalis]